MRIFPSRVFFNFFCLVLSFGTLASTGIACDLFVAPPLSYGAVYAERTPIFVGEVVGSTDAIEDENTFIGKAKGLKLKIVWSINHPASGSISIDLFYFRHGSDCILRGQQLEEPIGTRMILIGQETDPTFAMFPSLGRYVFSSKINGLKQVLPIDYQIPDLTDFDYAANRSRSNEKLLLGNGLSWNWIELMAMATDAKELKKLDRNSPRRKSILVRLSKNPYLDFPSFVDRRLSSSNGRYLVSECFHEPIEPVRPDCAPDDWTTDWENELIEQWEKIQKVHRKLPLLSLAPDRKNTR